ncbi:MAG TPA: cyclic nucleotide-binding domain-containing protein [Syntrophobacteraceae bacterium]|nr:cyclic nucleotide-binding domain-containing protein [Syntrophobacteraceae bacterium]
MISIDLLKSFGLFEGFSDGDLKGFADVAAMESYKAGVELWKQGDPAEYMLLLLEGKVLMTLDIDAGPHRAPIHVTVDIMSKGEALGWSSVVEPYVYTRTVRCLDDSKMVALKGAQLREILNEDSGLGFKFMCSIAKLLRNRLSHTEIILVGERGLSILSKD